MDDVPIVIGPETPLPSRRRILVASALGAVGGAGAIGAMWLPLANLAGLGPVGCFDYNHTRVHACIGVASLVIVFSVARCFRTVLLAAGALCGLLAATGIDLFQALHEVMSMDGGDLALMARQMVAHSSLKAGAYLLPLCGIACVVAGALGSSPGRSPKVLTSGS